MFAQFATGLRLAFIVGALGGGIAAVVGMLVGFTAGYRSGIVDEILNMLTNVVLVIPTFAVLLVIAAYLKVRGIMTESLFIGLTSWPWAARALRAQTFSLVSRDFVDMARLSGRKSRQIIFKEIAPNMSSYLFMMFILLFGGSILIAATLDFIGLGPSNTISLGMMMQLSVQNAALQLHMWWWFLPPGLAIMAIVGSPLRHERRPRRGLQPQAQVVVSLAVDDLKVYYRTLAGDVQALDGVTFGIADGEIMGLAGESGCGKSTLGKSLIRFDTRMRYVGGHVDARRRGAPRSGTARR